MRAKPLPLPLARHPHDHSASMVCRMVFDELCVLANGDMVCSCGDPAGLRVYGNVHCSQPLSRGLILRRVVNDPDFFRHELNQAFVLLLYFGYLQRNPDDAPDLNMNGYDFWLSQLESNLTQWDVIRAFVRSEVIGIN